MKQNPSETINVYKGRDVSPFLFHFVKGENPMSVLEQILKDNALKTCQYPFVCYTESPLRVMKDVLDYFQTFRSPMFAPYGIGLKKEQMFKTYGARPVIYGSSEEKNKLDKSIQWRFEQLDFENWDFSWQREWRTAGNYFELPEDDEDVIVICKQKDEIEHIKTLTDHPVISLEWVEEQHASDYIVDANMSFQLMSDLELELLKEECEELRKKYLENNK